MLERFDRELRRASRAWQDAYGQAERDGDQLILTVPDGFVRELRKFPLPAVTERGHLEIFDARVDPLTLLTEPVGEMFAVLALWPLTALVFALASFGCDIEVCRWPPKESDRVMNGNPAERRGHYERLLQGAGSLADSREQEAFKISVPRSSLFRSVARHRDEDGGSAGEITILPARHLYEDQHDCVVLRVVMPQ